MSPRERSACIHLASLLIVFVPYFAHVAERFAHGVTTARPLMIEFVGALVVYLILNGLMHAIAAIAFGQPLHDERDAAIEARSLRVAYGTVLGLSWTALAITLFIGIVQTPSDAGLVWLPTFTLTSQYLLFSFLVAEALRYGTQLFCYRTGSLA